jgi:hypothetical protein
MSRAVLDRLDPQPHYTVPGRTAAWASTTHDHSHGTTHSSVPDKTARILDLSERNLDELQQLHEMILDEKEFDYGAVPEAKHKPFAHYPAAAAEKEGHGSSQTAPRVTAKASTHTPSRASPEPAEAPTSASKAETKSPESDTAPATKTGKPLTEGEKITEANRLAALQRENERLKAEIAPFDAQFFEELEDLKYRYSRLQEIVGEDPAASEPRRSALPLDRLSWSVRNSMTAMDRAGLTSPLVSRPRYANAYTYAPGSGGSASRDRSPSPTAHTRSNGATSATATGYIPVHGGLFDNSGGKGHVGGRISASANSSRRFDPAASGNMGIAQPLYEEGEMDDFAPSLNGE